MAGRKKQTAQQTRFDPPDMEKLPDFTGADVEEIKQAFDIFNRGGVIDVNEMLIFFEELNADRRYPTIYGLIKKIHKLFPKGASFKEFMEHMQFEMGEIKTGQGLTRFFELLDRDDKKYLDKERLMQVAHEIGENISEEDLEDLIAEDFGSEDGKVNVDQFYNMMIREIF